MKYTESKRTVAKLYDTILTDFKRANVMHLIKSHHKRGRGGRGLRETEITFNDIQGFVYAMSLCRTKATSRFMLLQAKVMRIVLEMAATRNKALEVQIRQKDVELEGCRAAIEHKGRVIDDQEDQIEKQEDQIEKQVDQIEDRKAEIAFLDTHRLHSVARDVLQEDYDYHGVNGLFRDNKDLLTWRGKTPYIREDRWEEAEALLRTLRSGFGFM